MSDWQTGATPEQIAAAGYRLCMDVLPDHNDPFREKWERHCAANAGANTPTTVAKCSAALVPPGYVIAPASQVVTPELRTALGKVLLDVKAGHRLIPNLMSWESDSDDHDAIHQLLEAAG